MALPFKSEPKNPAKTEHSIDVTTGEAIDATTGGTIDATTGETTEDNPIKSRITEIGNVKVVEILISHLEQNAIDAVNQRTVDLGQIIGAEMTDEAVTGEEITSKEGIIIAMTTVVVTTGVAIGIETTGKEIPLQSALATGIAQVVGNLILQIEQNVSVVENQKE